MLEINFKDNLKVLDPIFNAYHLFVDFFSLN